ncbi:MAG: Rrf2 family transcriptional regulator [Bryobacteraceae bacterium]
MFSQTTEYALRAVVWLSESPDEPQTTIDIAAATQVPAGYLSKVLQALGRAGIVRGSRGKYGGFELTRPAASMTILEIVNAVDPVRRIEQCPLGLASHRGTLCPLHRKMDDALASIESSFREVTLAELSRGAAGVRPLCETACAGKGA